MDEIDSLKKLTSRHIFVSILLENIVIGLTLYLLISYTSLVLGVDFVIAAVVALVLTLIISRLLSNFVTQPLSFVRQAILHLSPHIANPEKAPDIKQLKLGQELMTNLVGQLYEIAKVASDSSQIGSQETLSHSFIANSMPLPLFVLDKEETITFVNRAAAEYIGLAAADLIGKNIYMILDMAFPSEDTFDTWLKTVKQKTATASNSWERVRLNVRDNHPTLMFDLATYYNQGNSDGNTTMLVLFDHTKQYSQDDQAVSFVALSVHELRTPLTLLKGYMEVFEDELRGKVSPELEGFLDKMRASSDQLTAFANNILNVARIDDDQLELRLSEEDWAAILKKAIDGIKLRAKVRNIGVELEIQDNLPKVGVDRLSIQEVINNLIDNAIKYSGQSKTISIEAKLNPEGLVETTIQDFGVGIPASIMANLFTKFYRDHKNRAQIGGTGLGLYLSKAIVNAHGGNLWVRSVEDKGSTFGFTLVPFEQIGKENDGKEKDELVRSAHGWIKNHSYYRR